jgi:hypothetical protein
MSQRVKTSARELVLPRSSPPSVVYVQTEHTFFRKWPFSGGDDRGKTSSRALVFTRCDIQSE